jgi:hypothetical protein
MSVTVEIERDVHVLAQPIRFVACVLRARITVVAVRLRDLQTRKIVDLRIERARVRRAQIDVRAIGVDATRLELATRAATRNYERDERRSRDDAD